MGKTPEQLQELQILRHSASHLLAHAVKRLFPAAKLGIGPAIDNGFYYDFEFETKITEEDMKNIEKEMEKIKSERHEIERFELPRAEAIKLMEEKNESYKVQLINELPEDAVISFYKQGDFVDLCAGPHLENVRKIKAFKLLSITGAYWKGDAKNTMLQRIYGTAFDSGNDLDAHLKQMEEAKLRDHNKLGRELEFFTTSELVGKGLPIILPKGAKVIQLLQRFVEDEEAKRGWQLTKTPYMGKSDIYKISGHWDHYRDGMFVIGDAEKADNEEILALRPMTCPFQYQAYMNRQRSYKDLPIRYNESSTLFRNEASGEMHGLIRVRQFTISEGHLMCTPEQLAKEFKDCLELANFMLKSVGLYEDVSYCFSQWDPADNQKYIGTPEQWDEAQNTMEKILKDLHVPYTIGIGDAAFYGPKLDIQIKNVFGKEDTLITIQIDQMLAEKFGMEYVDKDGTKKHPYIIHRTSIGCYERTLALLIEKYAGAFPVWLAPTQVKLLTVTEKFNDYAKEVMEKLAAAGLRVELDERNEKIGYKIREARNERIPYLAVIGEKEMDSNSVAVRSRKEGELGPIPVEEFLAKVLMENATRVL